MVASVRRGGNLFRMFFGLTIEKVMVIAAIAAILVGPERLPRLAEGLARVTHRVRGFLSGAKERMREEIGPDFDETEWRKLDPRQYDPRRIIREALLDDAPSSRSPASVRPSTPTFTTEGRPPFDAEAT